MITKEFPPQAKLDIAITLFTALSLAAKRTAEILSRVKVIADEE